MRSEMVTNGLDSRSACPVHQADKVDTEDGTGIGQDGVRIVLTRPASDMSWFWMPSGA